MSKYREPDYHRVAARMALQQKVSRAASRLTRQMLDCYLGLGWVFIDAWEAIPLPEEPSPAPGYRLAVELHLDKPTALGAESRRVASIVKAATDREPFLLDRFDDGIRAVVRFAEAEGEAELADLCFRAAATSADTLH